MIDRGLYYQQALVALTAAHAACFEANQDALGMSGGKFSGVNETLGIICKMQAEINDLQRRLKSVVAE